MGEISGITADLNRNMTRFANDYPHLARTETDHYGRTCMCVDDPGALASFVAFCSGKKRRVFLRGSTINHQHSVPSLFRDVYGKQCDDDELDKRWSAYKDALNKLKALDGTRWDRCNLGAVFQHYGMRSPWLDVVRNLHTAIWFAIHDFESRGILRVAVQSEQDSGWISAYVREPPNQSGKLIAQDIVGEQSSRHFRPHAQQGLSLAMQDDHASCPSKAQDFIHYRIAQIRFPNSKQWKLAGTCFRPGSCFLPPSTMTR